MWNLKSGPFVLENELCSEFSPEFCNENCTRTNTSGGVNAIQGIAVHSPGSCSPS